MHSAGLKTKRGVVRADEINSLRIRYYLSIGLDREAIVPMLTPDPTEMLWLTPVKAKTMGIEYTVV